jgi:hypothetical protein
VADKSFLQIGKSPGIGYSSPLLYEMIYPHHMPSCKAKMKQEEFLERFFFWCSLVGVPWALIRRI